MEVVKSGDVASQEDCVEAIRALMFSYLDRDMYCSFMKNDDKIKFNLPDDVPENSLFNSEFILFVIYIL